MSDHGSPEDRLIAKYFRPLATHPGAFGFTDDCAAIAPPAGHDLVLNTDGMIAGVHFFPNDPADLVAKKALRMNLSDLAAKGATPLGFLLAIALPKGFSEDWLAGFARGLGEDAETYKCPLLGGDTDKTPGPISISISTFGSLPSGTMVRRAGAKPGDRILVSGTIGDAALGLSLRKGEGPEHIHRHTYQELVQRHLLPQPRTAAAEAVRTHASAAMDVSDGLAADLAKLCRASGLTTEIDFARVPVDQGVTQIAARDPKYIDTILTGGEDYEILCAVPPDRVRPFCAAAKRAGVLFAEIGTMAAGDGPPRFVAGGRPLDLKRPGYSHF